MHIFFDQKKRIIILFIIIIFALFHFLDLKKHLTLSALKANFDTLQAINTAQPIATATVYITIFIILSALALPGPLIMCLAAGAMFGVITGTVYSTVAATIGASLAFLASRYLFREIIQQKFGKRLLQVNKLLKKEGFVHLLLIRLIPVLPFTLINVGAGLTKISLRSFVLATFIGIIPPGLILCNAGANLAEVENIREILSIKVLGSFLLLGIFPLMAIFHRRMQRKKANHF
jgi:uncharacterized membrane protein YdjX (TVP38/TMEM64 family)